MADAPDCIVPGRNKTRLNFLDILECITEALSKGSFKPDLMQILTDLVIILSVSAVILYISVRLNIPSIIGFLVAGLIAGPSGIELISSREEVDILAEIGILLLLFTIGIEFSLEKLLQSKRYILGGGITQVGLSIVLFGLLAMLLGVSFNSALFIGMLFAMSSTAIVLQILQEKGWTNTEFGKASISILIFQDIIIIPMMLLAPYLSAQEFESSRKVTSLITGVVIIVVVLFLARRIVPGLLRAIVHTRNQELFLFSVIVICFATAFITNLLGLKLALGAFLAGLIVSESEFSFEALRNILPFKKIFTAIFFVSVGMLIDLNFLFNNLLIIVSLVAGTVVLKTLIIAGIALALRLNFNQAMITGLTLSQVGEFAFILSKTGVEYNLLSNHIYQIFLGVSILSMIITTFMIAHAHFLVDKLMQMRLFRGFAGMIVPKSLRPGPCFPQPCMLENHAIIIGYGPGGRRVAEHLKTTGEPYSVIEKSESTAQKKLEEDVPIYIGDASEPEMLKRAGIAQAKHVVITVPDAAIAEEITKQVRSLNLHVKIAVRTRYESEIDILRKLGADYVIPSETSAAERIVDILTGISSPS